MRFERRGGAPDMQAAFKYLVESRLKGRLLDDNRNEEAAAGRFPDFGCFRDIVLIEMKHLEADQHIGTAIPGLLPFIQLGSVSELGEAIAQLTGLADLVDLSKHAARVKERIEKELIKKKQQDIEGHNDAFRQARNDLQTLLAENAALAPVTALPDPAKGATRMAVYTPHSRNKACWEWPSRT